MSSLRLVILAERFWPLPDPAAVAMEQLGGALVDLGAQVTFLATRWEKSWPESFPFAGGELKLFSPPARGWFGQARAPRSLAQVLESLHGAIDGLIVALPAEGLATCGRYAAKFDLPWLVWACGSELDKGPLLESLVELWGDRDAVRRCRVVCESSDFVAAWQRQGLPRTSLLEVEPAIELPATHPSFSRDSVRRALVQLDPRLQLGERQQVCLALGPIRCPERWFQLVQAWPLVSRLERGARLWLMGEGDGFARLWEFARRQQDSSTIEFLNWFDTLDAMFQAVDLLILPDRILGRDRWALRGMAAGLPVLAAAGATLPDRENSSISPEETPQELANRIVVALRAGRDAAEVAANQAWVRRHGDLVTTATRIETWLRELSKPQLRVGS